MIVAHTIDTRTPSAPGSIEAMFTPIVTLEVAADGTIKIQSIDWSDSMTDGWDPNTNDDIDSTDPRCEAAAAYGSNWEWVPCQTCG